MVNDLYIRLTDNCFFRDENNKKLFIKKRKNNIVKKFKLIDGRIEFFNEEIEFKMIPKKEKQTLEDIKITILVYDEAIIFQDIIGNLKVLDSNLEKVEISSLQEGDTITTYEDDSYVFEILKDKIVVENNAADIKTLSHVSEEPPEELDKIEKFSNYILKSEHGIVINDLLVCI